DALQDDTTSQFFALIKEIPLEKLVPQNHDQAAEDDREALEKLATSFLEKGADNSAALWTLDHCFSRLPRLVDVTLQELSFFLRRYYAYARLLFLAASHSDPIGNHNIRKLMGITEVHNDEFTMHLSAFRFLFPQHPSTLNSDPHSPPPLFPTRSHYPTETEIAPPPQRQGRCGEQAMSKFLNQEQYNARVGVHLQQMRILQLMYSAQPQLKRLDVTKSNIADWLNHLYEAFFPPVCYQGSIADIDWSTIQDAGEGIRIMKEWVRAAIYSLSVDSEGDQAVFLTSILRLTKLSFAFDGMNPLQYITQAAPVKSYRPPQLLRGPEMAYIVEDMLASIQGLTRTSVTSGILYLQHMLQQKLYVNLSVLCDCAEDVCSSAIIALHLRQWNLPPLHGLVLPRSWLIGPNKFKRGKEVLIDLFLDVMQRLLDVLASRHDITQDIYWLEHTKITVIHRHTFIQRICRMLCLLAYNAYTRGIRNRVEEMMSRLRSNDPQRATPPFYQRCALLE
ncbi:hypothetical protein BU15DRAFT_84182, partial [Melanogaster broomeanus]